MFIKWVCVRPISYVWMRTQIGNYPSFFFFFFFFLTCPHKRRIQTSDLCLIRCSLSRLSYLLRTTTQDLKQKVTSIAIHHPINYFLVCKLEYKMDDDLGK
jgi:hypothetical protein